MYFDYYAIGATTPVHTKITYVELAKYIATEWMPGTPITIMNGFADVLRSVLETENLRNYQKQFCEYWCVNPDLADTDRQWKGVTSWLLGVAFTRFTVESVGYPWWSPVSAFKGDHSIGSTTTGNWLMPHPRSQFHIQRKLDWPSTLYPDYVLGRLTSSGYAFAFCESKGIKKSIAKSSWNEPPSKWSNQVRSLELLFNDQPVQIAEHLIVATRVNPYAERAGTRKVVVRAWDIKAQADGTDAMKFASFLATHYAALCWRLGLTGLAQLMDFAATASSDNAEAVRQNRAILRQHFPEGYGLLFDDNLFQNLTGVQDLTVLRPRNARASFQLGDRLFEIALTAEALDIMRAIMSFNPSEITQVALSAVNRLRRRIRIGEDTPQQRIAITLNGLAVFDR